MVLAVCYSKLVAQCHNTIGMEKLKDLEHDGTLIDVQRTMANRGTQDIFQPGYTTFICHDFWDSVNNNAWNASDPGKLFPDAGTGKVAFKWNERNTVTLNNHSALPISVKMYKLKVRNRIDDAIKGATTPTQYRSWAVKMAYYGFLDMGIVPANLPANNQGFLGAAADQLLSLGEGVGAAGGATVAYHENANSAPTGVCYPIGMKLSDNGFFQKVFKITDTESIVLAPGQSVSYSLNDTKIRWQEYWAGISGSLVAMNPWLLTNFLHNEWFRTIGFEITGSLEGQDPMINSSTVATAGSQAWLPTIASNDNLAWADIQPLVTTHGGLVRMYHHKEWHTGHILSDRMGEDTLYVGTNANVVTDPGSHISKASEVRFNILE